MSIAELHAEGRLIRRKYEDTDAQGRELLCLYTAIAGRGSRPGECSADLCPVWLQHMLPWIDDDGTAEAWPRVVERVAALEPRLGELSATVEWRVRALCVREAMQHTDDEAVLAVCERVASLCEARGRGDHVDDDDMRAARAASWAAADAAAWAADAAEAAAAATAADADAVSRTASWAAVAAEAAAAATAARDAAEVAAAADAVMADAVVDRLIDAILDELERELGGES